MQPSHPICPPSPVDTSWREDAAIAAALLEIAQVEALLLRRDLLLRKYDPDQPRVPSGNTGGGRWTSGGEGGGGGGLGLGLGFGLGDGSSGDVSPEGGDGSGGSGWSVLGEERDGAGALSEQTVADRAGNMIQSEYRASLEAGFDERHTVTMADGQAVTFETAGRAQTIREGGPDGDVVSRALWTPNGPERDATVQPVFLDELGGDALAIFGGGVLLFDWLSGRNGAGGQQTVMGFNARDFQPDANAPGSLDLSYVGKISEDEARAACPYLPDVQARLDKAAKDSGPIGDRSPQGYGTDVHVRLKREIDAWNNARVSAERSYFKERDAASGREPYYSERGTVRVDVREWTDDGTMCLYDIKTGREGLSLRRSTILGHATMLPHIRRVIVMELRPPS